MITAGAAKLDITPAPGTPMAGYRARSELARGIHDRLFVRALALDDGQRGLLLLTLDLLTIDEELVAAVRQQAIPRLLVSHKRQVDVVVCATHTHSGPSGIFPNQPNYNPILFERVVHTSSQAAVAAWESRRPARLSLGACKVNGVASNRRDASLSFDPLLKVMKIEDRCGIPISYAFNYACHPTVLDATNLFFSRDWPGYTEDMVETSAGGSVALFFNGAAGDVSTRHSRRAATFAEAERLGRIVAKGVLSAADQAKHVPCDKIAVLHQRVELPRKAPIDLESARAGLAKAQEELENLRRRSSATAAEIKRAESTLLAWQVLYDRSSAEHAILNSKNAPQLYSQGSFMANIYVADLQEIVLVFVPGEATARVGAKIIRTVAGTTCLPPERIWFIGYANGHIGYLVDDDPSESDASSYEALMSCVTPAAATIIERSVLEMIYTLRHSVLKSQEHQQCERRS